MEVLSLLFGIIFWPAAVIAWLVYCRQCRVKARTCVTVLAVLIGLPGLAAASMAKYMFLDEPLYYAVADGDVATAQRLLAHGASPNTDVNGHWSLNAAAYAGDAQLVRLLLAHGAGTNSTDDEDGTTPLAAARKNGHAEVVALLSGAGAKR